MPWPRGFVALALVAGAACAGPPRPTTLVRGTLPPVEDKILLVNFWATWCDPCKDEMPKLEAIYQKHRKEDVVVVGVLVNDNATDDHVEQVADGHVTYPIVRGPSDIDHRFIKTLPVTLLYDREHRLRAQWVGTVSQVYVERAINAVLMGAAPLQQPVSPFRTRRLSPR